MDVNLIPPEQIDLGRRYRKDYGAIDDLIETIKQYGVIQPLAVVHKGMAKGIQELATDLDPAKPFLLIAGGRRLTAILRAKERNIPGLEKVPVRLYTNALQPDEVREIELFENIHRKDLDWQERNDNVAEIHRLRQRRLGKTVSHNTNKPATEKPSVTATAKMLNMDPSLVSKELKLSKDLEQFPEVREKARSRDEALKLVRQRKEDILMKELAKRREAKIKEKGTSEVKKGLIEAYRLEDCFTFLPKVKAGVVGFVNLDPPWANVKMAQKKSRPNLASFDNWTEEEYGQKIPILLAECYRIMSDSSWGVFWYSPEPWHQPTLDMIRDAGFTCNGIPALWCKGHGHGENVQFNLTNTAEFFFYFRKGSPEIRREGHGQEFRYTPVRANRIHKCEKPVELMEDILTTFCLPRMLAVDPFAGSGALMLAAHNVGMRSLGCDLAEESRSKYVLKVEGNENDRRFI